MKKITIISALVLLTVSAFAQAPQTMSYQAVVRNSSNVLIQKDTVGIRISLLQGGVSGTSVYTETHSAITNQNGLLDIKIGGGTIVSGTYHNGIFWGGGPYFLKTEIDPLGGKNYTITSTSELLSVPYSNYSHVSGYSLYADSGRASAFADTSHFSKYADTSVYSKVSDTSSYAKVSGTLVSPLIGLYLGNERVFVTYLDFNKVAVIMNFQLRTDIDPDNGTFDYTWCGVISGNTITFPSKLNLGGLATMSGTINGNALTLTLYFASDPTYIYTFKLVKQ